MNTIIETITPDIARSYLGKNTSKQRKVRYNWVESLARMITDDSFILTHQGIAFDELGNLIDGQHRLLAVIMADKPITIMVSRNVGNNAWHGTDQGIIRRVSEITTLSKRVGQAANYISRIVLNETRPHANLLESIGESQLGLQIGKLSLYAPTTPKYFGQTPNLVVAAMRSIMDGGDYAFTQYRALTLQDYDAMSLSSKALCRQVVSGKAISTGPDLWCRAWKTFDKSKADQSKIQISEDQVKPIMAQIRFHMENLIK